MKVVYNSTEYPDIEERDECYSVDVITMDKDGLLNIAFYDYDTKKWRFHIDNHTDDDFRWCYAPDYLRKAFKYDLTERLTDYEYCEHIVNGLESQLKSCLTTLDNIHLGLRILKGQYYEKTGLNS
jgi:hypothetical protein